MPCDVCSKAEGCYALSTTQAITTPVYWIYFFRHYPQQVALIGGNGEQLASYVLARTTDKTGWAVCESCIQMYSVNRSKARQRFQTWVQSGKPPTDFGAAPFKEAFIAAIVGWERVFGSKPQYDPDIPAQYFLLGKQDTSDKKWWQFWKS